MQYTAKDLARIVNGTVEGDENVLLWKPCKIEEGVPGGITFLANPKYTHFIYESKPSAILVNRTFQPEHPIEATLIRVDNPYFAVAQLLHFFNQQNRPPRGRSLRASVGRGSHLGKDCYVGEFAVVGRNVRIGNGVKIYPQVYVGDNAVIGDNTILYSGAKLYRDTVVGRNCIIHSGAVLGADGFGFAPTADGSYSKIDQIGNVVIEDDVEIGANTCIDRATMGSTVIHQGAKIDNLCQLAHNVVVGSNTAIASQSGVAGSGKIGANCVIAGQVGIVGHIEIGNNVTIGAKSGVTRGVKDGTSLWGGFPALEGYKQKRLVVLLRNLEDLFKRVSDLERH